MPRTPLPPSPRDNSGLGTYRELVVAPADSGFISADLYERLTPSAGLRDIITHEYVEVDLNFVADAAGTALMDYRAYVRSVAQALQDRRAENEDTPRRGADVARD